MKREFEAAHSLRGDFGPASEIHGHTYTVVVTLRGESLGEDGTLLDIVDVEGALDDVLQELNYANINEVPYFREHNPTMENVSKYIGDSVAEALGNEGLGSLEVQVWENPRTFASYRKPMNG